VTRRLRDDAAQAVASSDGYRRSPQPDRKIDTFIDQIHIATAQRNSDNKLGPFVHELADNPQNVAMLTDSPGVRVDSNNLQA
jgi:hypothetical protein